jgi:hypothetical protein
MTPKFKADSRRLVIDASVARAAGQAGSRSSPSAPCREFLLDVLNICHRAVMSPKLRDEWRRNASRFARKWHKQMTARRKIINLGCEPDQEVEKLMHKHRCSDRERAALMKDLHLIEAALAADEIVISLDGKAREQFARAAKSILVLRAIAWIDPCDEFTLAWLRAGAKKDQARLLP